MLRSLIYLALILPVLLPCALQAEDDYNADFSLRFAGALTRFAGYADVAAVGNTSAGSKWSTSVNPASTAWQPAAGRWKMSFTPQYSALNFDEGTQFHVFSESLLWEIPGWGTFLPAAAQVRSNDASTRQGPDLEFDADYFQLQWGIHPDPRWAIGFNFNYIDTELTFSQGGVDLIQSEGEGYDFRAGLLFEPKRNWRMGIVADYGWTKNVAEGLAFTPAGVFSFRDTSTSHQFILRPGISYEYAKDSTVFLDYQLVALSDSTGHLDLHRFSAGVDHQLFKGAFIRAGVLVDTEGKVGPTAGFGIAPAGWISIDFAYQYEFFPELEEELGSSQTFTVSVVMSF